VSAKDREPVWRSRHSGSSPAVPNSTEPNTTEHQQLAERIAPMLDGRTVATAESCTAGRIAETLACVPGATEFLRGGVVAYQEEMKRKLLGVVAESVLSLNCARQMAEGVRALMGADIGVSTTGVAGDKPEEGILPGTVFIGVAVGEHVDAQRFVFTGEPTAICDQARDQALRDLMDALVIGITSRSR
jgi:nicotinamide-nucleotide amidase